MRNRRVVGCVHGRFQPFHNEHLTYVLMALERCGWLWIGLTQYEPTRTTRPLGRDREKPEANPLSYLERVWLITAALEEQGIQNSRFGFTPFPIDRPELLSNYVSNDIVCYTTLREDWNREKIGLLTKYGYNVEVLIDADKSVAGSDVRRRVLLGDESWRDKVPAAVAEGLDALEFRQRLSRLAKENHE